MSLHNAVRDAGTVVEEALVQGGWGRPGRMIRLPQPDVANEPTAVISETGVGLSLKPRQLLRPVVTGTSADVTLRT